VRPFVLALLLCCPLAGCNDKSAQSPDNGARADNPANTERDKPTESKPDLSVPRLERKNVVWIDSWRGSEKTAPARQVAEKLLSFGDRLKAAKKYAEAEKYYERSMAADPAWAYPAYQQACNYELWNRNERAVPMYAKAMELGFDDFPAALVDTELGQIRSRPDFTATLLKIRERYIAVSASRVGQPIALRADGNKPADGWPMMLLLHGYGDSNLSYLSEAHQWAKLGFVAVTIPGTVPSRSGCFQWDMESTEPTQQDLQAVIQSPIFDALADRKKVFLLGFSQGALHALLLTAEHPELYAGVVSISPGGSLWKRLAHPKLSQTRFARCMFVHGLQEPHAPLVRIWSNACQAAGWKFDSKTHPGGHRFPENWDQMRPEVAAFLIQ
jgi:predicted esterase